MVEGKIISIGNVAYCLGMSGKKLHRWYKEVLSGYEQALQQGQLGKENLVVTERGEKKTIGVPICNPDHLGEYMAIDEKNINGRCYTVLSNRQTNKIMLMADTLKSQYLLRILPQLEFSKVVSLTRDMAQNYEWFGRQAFVKAYHVVDKFHVIKHGLDALQSIRICHRQEELSKRRKAQQERPKKKYPELIYENGDTTLQLLARSRGLLFKQRHEWTDHQKQRAAILFELYPNISSAYKCIEQFRKWYKAPKSKTTYAKTIEKKRQQLMKWIKEVQQCRIPELLNFTYLLERNIAEVINYFRAKETNAKAEALNRNMQRFINVNYGARNTDYFLFRLAKHFA